MTSTASDTISGRAAQLAARVGGLTGRRRWLAAFVAGALLTLAQPPVSLPVFLFVAFPLLLWLLDGEPARTGWRIGWLAGFGYFSTGLYWIAEAFLVDIVRHGWMAPFAVLFMSGGLALFWAAAFAVARRARPGIARAVALAAALALAEYARSHVFTGFPWALQAYAWVETPVAQAASLFGPHLLGLLTVLAALAPATLARGARWPLAAAAAMVAAGLGWGVWRVPDQTALRADGFTVRVVQPNAPQREKWLPERERVFFRRLLTYSAPVAARGPDMVIWPETAVPYLVDEDPEARRVIAAAAGPARVALGVRRVDRNGARPQWRNALAVLSPGGAVEATYDKRHLVPFGEYIPFYDTLSGLGLGPLVGESGGFSPGTGSARIDLPGAPPFVAQICYETIFPHEMPGLADRPEWILQVTNDAWFGATGGPPQHLAQARMRAIELGLPVVRSANTGISAVIGPHGRVVESLPLLTEGAIESVLPAPLDPTHYVRIGDIPAVIVSILMLALTSFTPINRHIVRRH